MIRPTLLKAISVALQSHPYLSQEDFITREFKNRAESPAIEIKYRYNTTLFFKFVIPTKRTDNDEYIFHVTVQPGHESIEESLSTKSRNGLTSELREWLNRLYEDNSVVADRAAIPRARAYHRAVERTPRNATGRADIAS